MMIGALTLNYWHGFFVSLVPIAGTHQVPKSFIYFLINKYRRLVKTTMGFPNLTLFSTDY